jgi:hypothetical protein
MYQECIVGVDEFFLGKDPSRQLFDVLYRMTDEIGPIEIRVTKSQISFMQGKAFAWVWMPGRYLQGKVAPLVLTLVFSHRDGSTRWKEIVEPSLGNYTHHLELYSIADIDDQVRDWLKEAWLNRTQSWIEAEPGSIFLQQASSQQHRLLQYRCYHSALSTNRQRQVNGPSNG